MKWARLSSSYADAENAEILAGNTALASSNCFITETNLPGGICARVFRGIVNAEKVNKVLLFRYRPLLRNNLKDLFQRVKDQAATFHSARPQPMSVSGIGV